MREYEAVVFDMDGVIFDSEKKVVECWQVLADKYGFTGIEQACRACLGTTKEKSKEIMLQRYGEDFPYETYSAEASKLFHERYDGGRLPKKTGIEKILQALSQKGKKIALASSTRRQTVESQLREAGLIGYFDKIICGDMVEKASRSRTSISGHARNWAFCRNRRMPLRIPTMGSVLRTGLGCALSWCRIWCRRMKR